jgi:hypothetical protein
MIVLIDYTMRVVVPRQFVRVRGVEVPTILSVVVMYLWYQIYVEVETGYCTIYVPVLVTLARNI